MNGQCEPNPYGPFESKEECEEKCEAVQYRDVMYTILAYDINRDSRTLAPSDQGRVVQVLLGRSVPKDEAGQILEAMESRDLRFLAYYSELEYYVLNIAGVEPGTPESVEILTALRIHTGYQPGITDLVADSDDNGEAIEHGESERMYVLAKYPSLYPYLQQLYDNEDFVDMFADTLAEIPTHASLNLINDLQALTEDGAERDRLYYTMYHKATRLLPGENDDIFDLLKEYVDMGPDDYELEEPEDPQEPEY
jgi:hypothetical protein